MTHISLQNKALNDQKSRTTTKFLVSNKTAIPAYCFQEKVYQMADVYVINQDLHPQLKFKAPCLLEIKAIPCFCRRQLAIKNNRA